MEACGTVTAFHAFLDRQVLFLFPLVPLLNLETFVFKTRKSVNGLKPILWTICLYRLQNAWRIFNN